MPPTQLAQKWTVEDEVGGHDLAQHVESALVDGLVKQPEDDGLVAIRRHIPPCAARANAAMEAKWQDVHTQSRACWARSTPNPYQSVPPTTRVLWPFPVVSSSSTRLPGPKQRASPSLVVISISPARVTTNQRLGVVC